MTWQPFCPIENDGGRISFHTDSWTRPGHSGHELTLTLSDLSVHCSCEDATCRMKNQKKITDAGHCKHFAKFKETIWPVIARAIGAKS